MNGVFRARLLGTGSPRPSVDRAGASVLVQAGDQFVLVDAGERALIRLLEYGEPVPAVTTLLLTHLHTDHTLGYGHFVIGGWTLGRSALCVLGPPGTVAHHGGLIDQLYAQDIAYRIRLGRDPAGLTDVDTRDVDAGVIWDRDGLQIRAAWVVHQLPTLAYRFDYQGRALVVSGDTAPCAAIVDLAHGAEVLIQDCCLDPDARDLFVVDRRRQTIWAGLQGEHCSPEQAGAIAAAAHVKRLVLTHFLVGRAPDRATGEAAGVFSGPVIAGQDGLVVNV